MSTETNRRVVLRTAAGVDTDSGLSDGKSVTERLGGPRLRPPHRCGTLVAPDEACGIAFWSRPAGPRLVRRPRTDPHPKGKDPS